MSKHVLIISTSPRKGGNSDVLVDEFARGAQEAGNHVEKVALYDQTVGFCKGCLACQSTGHCVIHDDANAIVEKMLTADVIVFATPIYYYEMCGQMKTMLDRPIPCFPLITGSGTFTFWPLRRKRMNTRWMARLLDFRAGSPALKSPAWPGQFLPAV